MLPISIIFSTILTGCAETESKDTSTATPSTTDLVDFTYTCDNDNDMCMENTTTVELEIGEFESHLSIDDQLTEENCKNICVEQSVPASYNICGCSYDGISESGSAAITCITYECAVEGRGHAEIQKAVVVSGPTPIAQWFARAFHAEASSVGSFLQLRAELARHNAPTPFLRRCAEAAKEEVMHARMMSKYCAAEGGRAPDLNFGSIPERSLFELALDNAVEGCVFETYAALRAHYQSKHATDRRIRKIMTIVARDETKHAQLAWDLHEWLLSKLSVAQKKRIEAAQRRAFSQLFNSTVHAANHPIAAELGLPDPQLAKHLANRIAA